MFNNLKAEITRAGIKKTDLAKELGISVNTLINKLNGKKEFKLSEVQVILKMFPDKDIDILFERNKNNNWKEK